MREAAPRPVVACKGTVRAGGRQRLASALMRARLPAPWLPIRCWLTPGEVDPCGGMLAAVPDSLRTGGQDWLASAPGENRTRDLPLRRRLLYPLSYGGTNSLATHRAPNICGVPDSAL